MKTNIMDCSICEGPIEKVQDWDLGNNAEPVNSGRCCDTCNLMYVVPTRMKQMFEAEGE